MSETTTGVEARRALLKCELARIPSLLAGRPDVVVLWAFGSLASDRADEWSDLDLGCVRQRVGDPLRRPLRTRRDTLADAGKPGRVPRGRGSPVAGREVRCDQQAPPAPGGRGRTA